MSDVGAEEGARVNCVLVPFHLHHAAGRRHAVALHIMIYNFTIQDI